MSTMLTISGPISTSYGFVSITITSTTQVPGVGAGEIDGGEDGSFVGSQTIGSHDTSKSIAMYPSVPSLGRLQASQSSMSKSSPT